MATYTTLRSQIDDDLAGRATTAQIDAAILEAIRHYEGERFVFNETVNQSVTLTVSVAFLAFSALPARFIEIDRLRLVQGSGTYDDLEHRDYSYLMYWQDARAVAQPIEYALFADTIQFDAIANQSYTLILDGLVSLGNAASNSFSASDAGAWFNAGRELIRARSKWSLYANILKDASLAATYGETERQAYQRLKAKATQRGSGYLRPTQF